MTLHSPPQSSSSFLRRICVSIFYGVSTKFPSEERINEILCQKCQHDDQSNDSISDSATSNDTNINEITPTETIKTEQLKQDQIKPPESKLVPTGGEANLIKVANENDVDPVNSSEVISPKIGMKQSNSQSTLSIVFSDILIKYWFFHIFCCSKVFSMLSHGSISSTYVVNARPHFTMASFLFRNSNILNYSINCNSNSYLMGLQCYGISSSSICLKKLQLDCCGECNLIRRYVRLNVFQLCDNVIQWIN